jgi:tetratricopeptide (TPR) repeat protein
MTANLNHEYGFLLVRTGERAAARRVFTGALASAARPSALRSLALLDMFEGRYRQAQAHLEEAILLTGSAAGLNDARNRLFLAQVHDGRGRRGEALTQLRAAAVKARAAGSSTWLLARIGVECARIGALGEAAALLEDTRKGTDARSPSQLADLQRLEGELALARGDHRLALERLAVADHTRRSAFTMASLARAHRLAGNRDEATRCLEDLLAMKNIALGFEPQRDWIEAHYWLASLRASARQTQNARTALDALAALMRDADADLPLLKRLQAVSAGLERETRTNATTPHRSPAPVG